MNSKKGLSRIMSALLAASSMIGGASAREKKVVKKANGAGLVLDGKKNRRRSRRKKADVGVGTVSSSKGTSGYSFWKDPRSYGEAILGLSTLGLGTAAVHYRNESNRRVNDVISKEINKGIFRDLFGKLGKNEQKSLIESGFELAELKRGGESVDWSNFAENQEDGARKFDSVVFNFEVPYNEGGNCKYRFEVIRCRKDNGVIKFLDFGSDEDRGKIRTDHCCVVVYEGGVQYGSYYFTFDDNNVIKSIANAVAESIYIVNLNYCFDQEKAKEYNVHKKILTNICSLGTIIEGKDLGEYLSLIGGNWVKDVPDKFKYNEANLKIAEKIFVDVLVRQRSEKSSIQGGK